MTSVRAGRARLGAPAGLVRDSAIGLAVAAAVVAVATLPGERAAGPLAVVLPLAAIAFVVLVVNPRVELSLAALLAYLGLLDGYLKLRTGNANVSVLRDVLLYGIVVGVLVRAALQRTTLRLPRYGAHILLVVALVAAQALNPATAGLRGAAGGLRQHLEYVPLFFLGYLFLRSQRRLQWLLAGLLVVTAANAAAAVVQYTLTPDQFAAWGPGYADRILGRGAFEDAARVFGTSAGDARVRPFGLGSDFGTSGVLGYLALPAAIAFLAVARTRRERLLGALGIAACVIGVAASQSRSTLLLAAVAAAFLLLVTVTPATARRTAMTLLVATALGLGALALFAGAHTGSFDRFRSVAPNSLRGTVQDDRGGSIALVGDYALRYPLGDGLGRVGPAADFGRSTSTANAETEFNFLIVELGTLGMLAVLALWLRVLVDGVVAVRRTAETRERHLLGAVVSAVAAMAATWWAAPVSVGATTAPLFWLLTGVVAWAVTERAAGDRRPTR